MYKIYKIEWSQFVYIVNRHNDTKSVQYNQQINKWLEIPFQKARLKRNSPPLERKLATLEKVDR